MTKKLKVLDLFSGTRSIAKAFEDRGHEVYTIEWDKVHKEIDWYADMMEVTAKDVLERFGQPDVVWASPPCNRFSVASIGKHWHKGTDLPKTKEAEEGLKLLEHTVQLIKDLNPTFYFIENPRGKMRKMDIMQDLPRYTVTYCQYGDTRMKPTDLWTNHPNPDFKPMCKNGEPCHVAAPRGSSTGTQGIKGSIARSIIPEKLCNYIVDITTTYDLYDINGHEEELTSRNETLTNLKEFVNIVFNWDDEFLTGGLTFLEMNERLEGIGYWAKESKE